MEAIEKEASSSAARTEEKTSAVDYPSASKIRVKDLLGVVNENHQKYIPESSVKWSSRASEKDIKTIFMATKNRVTATQFASSEAIANTSHSPRFDKSVPQTGEVVKQPCRDVNGDSI